jgi:hypothetical protein
MHAQHGRGARVIAAAFTAVLLAVSGASAGTAASGTPQATGTGMWQQAMQQLLLPGRGCFTAAYPEVQWEPATCLAAPGIPAEPAPPAPLGGSPPPETVGGVAPDYAAQVTGLMTSATGSFDSESPGVTESGPRPTTTGPGPVAANMYSLQLNSQKFTTPACSSSPACVGWEQFVYGASSNYVFVQYWLEHYDTACPAGWRSFTFSGAPSDIYCYTSSLATRLAVSAPAAGGLGSVTLTGRAPAGGTDAVVMTDGGHAVASATDPDSMLGLAANWDTAEFGVFGDSYGSQANFSPGTDLKVRVTPHNGTTMAPSCLLVGLTGESNNLTLATPPALAMGASPAMVSEQTSVPGSAGCAAASGFGDTHLTTFGDLLYDFQASGDFELATTGPGFFVQERQVSGAPSWPNAAVNQAVAASVGTSDVAVCTAPTRLFVNNAPAELADGSRLSLPGGGDVSLSEDGYLIRGPDGDWVRAQVIPAAPAYVNVSVGLSRWPEGVSGLLANAGTSTSALESRDGTVLAAPFTFAQFYGVYGDSWRVPANESLLSACGGKVSSGDPKALFYAASLPAGLAKQAQATCLDAGVRAAPLLDPCTVDVAVLGSKTAASVYLSEPADLTLGQITPPPSSAPAVTGTGRLLRPSR